VNCPKVNGPQGELSCSTTVPGPRHSLWHSRAARAKHESSSLLYFLSLDPGVERVTMHVGACKARVIPLHDAVSDEREGDGKQEGMQKKK
jgi:hypothetical protein